MYFFIINNYNCKMYILAGIKRNFRKSNFKDFTFYN